MQRIVFDIDQLADESLINLVIIVCRRDENIYIFLNVTLEKWLESFILRLWGFFHGASELWQAERLIF